MKEKLKAFWESFKAAVKNAWESFKAAVKKVATWTTEHPMQAAAIATTAVKVVNEVCDTYTATRSKNTEPAYDKVYDPRNGYYVYTRRRLTTNDWCNIDDARRNGASVTEAMRRYGLL